MCVHLVALFLLMSAFASPASVVRGPLPIHLDTLSRVVSLSHKYSKSTSGCVACSVRATAANSDRSELTPWSSRPTRTTRQLSCRWRQTLPAPISPLCADPSHAHVSPGNYSILVFPLLSPARIAFLDHAVLFQLVFVIFIFPCLIHTLMCFIVVQDDILMHPALHVSHQ
jgi:hypothetical protein